MRLSSTGRSVNSLGPAGVWAGATRLTSPIARRATARLLQVAQVDWPVCIGIQSGPNARGQWKILGSSFDWRLGALVALFVAFAVVALANFQDAADDMEVTSHDVDRAMRYPSVARLDSWLRERGQSPSPPALDRASVANVRWIYLLSIFINLIVIGALVALALLVIGLIRIDTTTTERITGQPAHVIWHLPIGHMVLTRELLALSMSLGGLASLSFAVVGLASSSARTQYVRDVTRGLRRVLVAHAVYVSAIEHERLLTGIGGLAGSPASPRLSRSL